MWKAYSVKIPKPFVVTSQTSKMFYFGFTAVLPAETLSIAVPLAKRRPVIGKTGVTGNHCDAPRLLPSPVWHAGGTTVPEVGDPCHELPG